MRYLLLIYANEADWDAASQTEKDAIMRGHGRLETDLRRTGQWGGASGAVEVRPIHEIDMTPFYPDGEHLR